jgi:hypothetical protein
MSHWEALGKSDEWYTPAYVFDALGERFDTDVAHPHGVVTQVPARKLITRENPDDAWEGFVWMNPPFGGRNSLKPWLDRFFAHGNGIALTPDRTSAPWWQEAAAKSGALLFIAGKVRFIRPDGSEGKSPSSGTTLFAAGPRATAALERAELLSLGSLFTRPSLPLGSYALASRAA